MASLVKSREEIILPKIKNKTVLDIGCIDHSVKREKEIKKRWLHKEIKMVGKKPVILVIDDEESMRDSCSKILLKDGFLAETAEDGSTGLEKARKAQQMSQKKKKVKAKPKKVKKD